MAFDLECAADADKSGAELVFQTGVDASANWLAEQPAGRFEFTFTTSTAPGSISWRAFFSKLARSVLRHIRVASKQELKERIIAAMDEFNRHPVVHTWSYKLDSAADMIRTLETMN